jgi:hypothetical protein
MGVAIVSRVVSHFNTAHVASMVAVDSSKNQTRRLREMWLRPSCQPRALSGVWNGFKTTQKIKLTHYRFSNHKRYSPSVVKRRLSILLTFAIGVAIAIPWGIYASHHAAFAALTGLPFIIGISAFFEWSAGNEVIIGWPKKASGGKDQSSDA